MEIRTGVQPSDAVKRFYGGIDIIYTFSPHYTNCLGHFLLQFWKRNKAPGKLFHWQVDFLLGKFANSNRAAHSVFVSFEKGQQPPLNNSGVNVVKLGYRIYGDRLFSLIGPR